MRNTVVSVLGVTLLSVLPPVFAAGAEEANAPPALDPALVEAFLDGVITTAMEDHHIPGVICSVVFRDEVVLEKGYGFAREPERVSADPRASLFRIASISKTFNATALMQLVEQGRVDLDADFTRYLPGIDFDLPRGQVRVRDLLTHSAGFEDAYFGHFWANDEASDHPLEEYVRRFQPAQVREPGKLVVYSNYGTSIVGLIVQTVSGEPYADYMEQHVLRPIGMSVSTFRDWPGEARDGYLPEALEPDLAHSYRWAAGRYSAEPWAWMHRGMEPAGGLKATAYEMTRWMRAHLGDGSVEGGQILGPDTLERMHGILIRNDPAVAGNAHGFWAGDVRGYSTLAHGGSIYGFRSNLTLIPELSLGIFASANAPSGARLVAEVPRRVIERFFELRDERPRPASVDEDALAEYAGDFYPLRTGYTTVLKAIPAFIGGAVVGRNADGDLTVTSDGATRRYVPIGGDRFVSPETGSEIAFARDGSRMPSRFFASSGTNVFQRVGFWGSHHLLRAVLALLAVGMLGRCVAVWLRRRETLSETPGERIARLVSLGIVPIWLVWSAAIAKDMTAADGLQPPHFAHFPTPLGWVWVIAGIVGVLLSLVLAVGLVPVWRQGSWPLWRRIRYTAYTVLCLCLSYLTYYWNLLGVRTLG